MALRSLDNVSCSLNLGLIYSLDYSYSPDSGMSIRVFFVNETGQYNAPKLLPMTKVNLKIGNLSFSVYPKSYRLSKSSGRKVIQVEFVDEFFTLSKYYVILPGRGCGKNLFVLGTEVDNRTLEQKQQDSLNPKNKIIRDFTTFPDYEYKFDEFLAILRQKFPVKVNAEYDKTITKSYVGSFREVLSSWCQSYNLAFYLENSEIKIYDATKLTIPLPSQPTDAISYEVSEDIGDTYGKTVCNYFQENGSSEELRNSSAGPKFSQYIYDTFYPVGYEFNLPQTSLDLKQVAAAAFGKEFWFLYNLSQGTINECGWESKSNVTYSANIAAFSSADINEKIFEDKFQAYYTYGTQIAGKWYLSNPLSNINFEAYQDARWYSQAEGQIFNFNTAFADGRKISLTPLESPELDTYISPTQQLSQIGDTIINAYYPGVNYRGKRMAFYDSRDYGKNDAMSISDSLKLAIIGVFNSVLPQGTPSANVANTIYNNIQITNPAISTLINNVKNGAFDVWFKPRYGSYSVVGIKNQLPTVYYSKYSLCDSISTSDAYFNYKFEPKNVSWENEIEFSTFESEVFNAAGNITKPAGMSTKSIRKQKYDFVQQLIKNPYLSKLALAKTVPTKSVSFTLNYFYQVPKDLLSNGLISMQMSAGDDGVSTSYTFSDSVLQVPNREDKFQQYEQQVKNSWIGTNGGT